jgi:hypothetical protein
MEKLILMALLIILISCTKNTSFSEEYNHIYTVLNNCIINFIGENIIADISFDFGYNINNVKELNLLRVYLYFDYGYYGDENIINNIIENNIINELFNVFYEESKKVLKMSDISIEKYYPFKIRFKKSGEYSKEEIELLNEFYNRRIINERMALNSNNFIGRLDYQNGRRLYKAGKFCESIIFIRR